MSTKPSIFITGKVMEATLSQLEEFELAAQRIRDLGFDNITTAADCISQVVDHNNEAAKRGYWSNRNMNLKNARIVLHLDNYQDDKQALQDVQLALNGKKELVMNAMKFVRKYSENS